MKNFGAGIESGTHSPNPDAKPDDYFEFVAPRDAGLFPDVVRFTGTEADTTSGHASTNRGSYEVGPAGSRRPAEADTPQLPTSPPESV